MFGTSTIRISAVVAATAALGPAPSAFAAPGAPPSKTVSAAERQQTAQTPIEQIARQARALDIPTRSATAGERPAADGPDGTGLTVDGALPTTGLGAADLAPAADTPFADAVSQNGGWTGAFNVNPNRQVGKLYFDIKPGLAVDWRHCTATAINSENKSLVLTAGHCVFNPDPDNNGRVDGNGFWFEGVHFCPGYEFGCKLGIWYARQLSTTNTWFAGTIGTRAYDWTDDVAVVLVKTDAVKGKVVNAVGGQGITFNQNAGLSRHSFGYPITDARWPQYTYSGEDLIYCRGTDVSDGYGHLRIACTMTGGASGGPWLISPAATWLGYVNSVNSHKAWGGAYMGGPYFGTAERDLFQYWRAR